MARVEVRGVSLEVVEQGSGEPLVLVHGSASDYRTWAGQQPRLGRRFRTIAYSRRYHWPNAPIPEGADYPMMEQAEDLEALLDAVGAAPAHVVAHSYGAFVALLLAIARPDAVRSLVLAEPPVLPLFVSVPPRPHEVLRLLLTRPRTAIAVIHFGATGIGPATAAFRRGDAETGLRAFGTAVLGKEAFARLSEERAAQVRANLIEAEFLGSGFAPLRAEDVRRIRAPTLLLSGARSPRIFPLLVDRLHELIPGADRFEIPGASHIVHEDNPDAFFDRVSSFLDGARVATGGH